MGHEPVAGRALGSPVEGSDVRGAEGVPSGGPAAMGPAAATLAQVASRPDLPGPDDLVRVLALDGPAGTGKSSVARRVAAELGWRFVDTGASYRAVTLAVLRSGVDPSDAAASLQVARGARVALGTDPQSPSVFLDGEDVSEAIRSPEVTAQVSAVSSVPAVRTLLIALQRLTMGTAGAVVEGRDIATVVAPRAGAKVYLDARPEIRALRRAADVHVGAHVTTPEAVERDLLRRDALDNQTNTLEVSDGALHLDTSELDLDAVVAAVVRIVRNATGPVGQPLWSAP